MLEAMWHYVLAWFPMVAIAVANGAVRQAWYGPYLSELRAHQVSTLTALVLLGLYMRWVVRRWPPGSAARAIAVGGLWFGLTLAFELLFGHYVARHAWSRLAADYDLLAGRLWPLVLVWVATAPYLLSRQRGR